MTKTQMRDRDTSTGVVAGVRTFFKQHWFITALCTVFLGLATILVVTMFNHQLNPDAMSYMTIAQKYADGNFRDALNGYWGPMMSWLLVPAVWMDINLSVAGKMISVIAAAVMLVVIYRFFESRNVSRVISGFTLGALGILLLDWSVTGAIAPDMLMSLFMVLFAIKMSNFIDKPGLRSGIALGLTGAALYFTKGFGFFLFVGVVGVIALWQWWKVDRAFMPVLRRYLPVAITFALVVLPFIAIISMKYDKFTINNAGAFNQHVNSPHYKGVQPPEVMGPLAPPNDSAVSSWEDPSIFVDLIPGWNPLSSKTNLGYFINDTIYKNSMLTINYLYGLGPLIVAGIVIVYMGAVRKGAYRKDYVVFGLIVSAMFAAYVLVYVVGRYLWGGALIGIVGLGLWMNELLQRKAVSVGQIVAAGLIICTAMALVSGNFIGDNRDPEKVWYTAAQDLKGRIPERSKVISDNFSLTNHACFYLDLRCYNVLMPPVEDQEAYYESLKKLGIEYYIDYGTRPADENLRQFVQTYFTLEDHRPHLYVYRIQ